MRSDRRGLVYAVERSIDSMCFTRVWDVSVSAGRIRRLFDVEGKDVRKCSGDGF